MKLNKYFPFAFIYFFINPFGLPFGLTYTALLAPVFYIWILKTRKKEILLPFLAAVLPFILIHLTIVGVEIKSYFLSLLNFILVYVFCQAVYTFLLTCKEPEKIFRMILVLNFILCLIAIPFYFTPYFEPLWVDQNIAMNVGQFRRLQLFTYEPSYYALLFTPIFFFYLLQYCFRQNTISGAWLFPMLFLPYVLSFSIGIIGAAIMAGVLLWLIYFRTLTRKRRIINALIFTGAGMGSVLVMLILFFRQNPVFLRIRNILSGEDSSGNGRVTDAFVLANKLLEKKNEFWGIGIGQIKIIGEATIRNYYLYYTDFRVAIPNAVAETMAIFGWVGVSLRFLIEISLFYYTRVWTNYYRLLLFLFIFIYQFTGSFITNVAEYVIWILAFTRTFQQFDIKSSKE